MYLDGQKNKVFTRHSLLLCYLFGPVGFLSHMLTRGAVGVVKPVRDIMEVRSYSTYLQTWAMFHVFRRHVHVHYAVPRLLQEGSANTSLSFVSSMVTRLNREGLLLADTSLLNIL